MINKNRLITIMAFFAMVLSMVTTVNVKAANNKDIDIISKTNVSADEAARWAKSKGATDTFIDLADLYWEYAEDHGGVNPGIAYVQAAKETGFGRFGGVLDESYCNPCGLKTASGGDDNDASAHEKFQSWKHGVQAHLDHLALYAGAEGYPRSDTYDPRHFATIKGRAETVNSLSVNWAPSATYGEEVNNYYRQMADYAHEDIDDEEVEEDLSDDESDSKVETSKKPYPAEPESKPAGLNVKNAVTSLSEYDSKIDDKADDTSSNGWKKEDGTWHYYDSYGKKATGWIKAKGNWYLFDNSGNMCSGWVSDYGVLYYFDQSGIMATGWKRIDNDWYLFQSDGKRSIGAAKDGNNTYFFDTSGIMKTASGWNNIDNKWYYFNSNSTLKTGWFKENNTWYYLQANGEMAQGGYYSIDGKVYGFDNGGKMITGWQQVNNIWYYFTESGDMVTGWKQINGTWYYFYDNGAMAKGWINLDDGWYYLKDNGSMVTGWVNYDGSKYYLNSSGKLAVSTTKDGYSIGSDGKASSTANDNKANNSATSTSNNTAANGNKDNNSGNNGNKNNENGNNKTNNNSSTVIYDKPQVSGNIVVVDAGHNYGGDYGAIKTVNGVTYDETILNMQVAAKLKKELETRGYTVIMTREEGEKPVTALTQSLTERVNTANYSAASVFISIHHNVASGSAMGVEVYYSSTAQDDSFGGNYSYDRVQKSKTLASQIASNVANAVGTNNRGAKDSSLFVCRNTSIPAVLVEVGFIDNAAEAQRCASDDGQSKTAKAIADAVEKYF